jgi:hypothetical protein
MTMSNVMPLIVLIEDDNFQSRDFEFELKEIVADAKVEIFCCGVEFLDAYEATPMRMPDVFVIDLMLDWEKGWINSKRVTPDPTPEQGETALICFNTVRRYSKDVPIILWTMSDLVPQEGTVDSKTTFFFKKFRNIEGDVHQLIRKILSSRKRGVE